MLSYKFIFIFFQFYFLGNNILFECSCYINYTNSYYFQPPCRLHVLYFLHQKSHLLFYVISELSHYPLLKKYNWVVFSILNQCSAVNIPTVASRCSIMAVIKKVCYVVVNPKTQVYTPSFFNLERTVNCYMF